MADGMMTADGWIRNGAVSGVECKVGGVFGASPKIAQKKLTSGPRCGMVEAGAAEGRFSNGAYCPQVSVVMGYVIDTGGSSGPLAAREIPRLRECTK
jgi:hypothetical protein